LRRFADVHRDYLKRLIVRADEKLTVFIELESAIRVCGELSRQAGDIFPKLAGYENNRSNSSNDICTHLLCAPPKHARGQPNTGRWLFWR
jgi:hypothetical protein